MLLNKDDIKTRCLVGNGRLEHFRDTSYDVSVGKVHGPNGEEANSFKLEPQQMVVVVSAETLFLTKDVAGYAMPRTRLSNRGILALSTGIVDPGYEGKVSSILINFGNIPYELGKDEAFLRISFHLTDSIQGVPDSEGAPQITEGERRGFAQALPSTFLDVPSIVSDVSREIVYRQRNFWTNFASIFAIILAAATFLLAIVAFLGTPYISSYIDSGSEVERLRERIQVLEERVNSLEEQSLTNSTTAYVRLTDI